MHPEWFPKLIAQFTDLNYSVRWQIRNLAVDGLAHGRKRLLVFGACPGQALPKYPAPRYGPGTGRRYSIGLSRIMAESSGRSLTMAQDFGPLQTTSTASDHIIVSTILNRAQGRLELLIAPTLPYAGSLLVAVRRLCIHQGLAVSQIASC